MQNYAVWREGKQNKVTAHQLVVICDLQIVIHWQWATNIWLMRYRNPIFKLPISNDTARCFWAQTETWNCSFLRFHSFSPIGKCCRNILNDAWLSFEVEGRKQASFTFQVPRRLLEIIGSSLARRKVGSNCIDIMNNFQLFHACTTIFIENCWNSTVCYIPFFKCF